MAKLAILGDSMIETGFDTVNIRTLNRWLSGPLVSLLGPAFEEYYNHGVGGDTIADCLARVGDIEVDADVVLVECGINNLSRSDTTFDSMTDDYETLLRALKAAGKTIVCCTVLERKRISQGGSVADDQYIIRPAFNAWLRKAYQAGAFDALVDFEGSVDYLAARDADDGTHPNTDKCVELAKVMASTLRGLGLSKVKLSENLLVTPQLMGSEGTTTGAHITGDIATGWRFLETQTGTEEIFCETVLLDDGGGQRFTFSGAPSGTGVGDFFRDNQSSVDISAGQTVMTSFKVNTANVSGIVGVYSQLLLPLSGGSRYLGAMYVSPADTSLDYRQVPPTMGETFYSPAYTTAENLTGCSFRIGIYYKDEAELSGSVLISDPQVRVFQ